MTTLSEAVNKLIRDSLALIVNDPSNFVVIKAKQLNAPRPNGSYADVDFLSSVNLGWEQQTLENNSGDPDLTETIEGMRDYGLSINFYRDNALDYARACYVGFIRQSIQELFSSVGVGLIRRSEIRETSEALENGWEERAQFDIFINLIADDQNIIRSIETVSIGGEHQLNNKKYNFNISNQ